MKHNDFSEMVRPYPGITTSCYYEMEIWVHSPNEEYDDEEIKEDLQHYGAIRLSSWRDSIGIYRTKKAALEHLEMIIDDPCDDKEILVVDIRQKPAFIQMGPFDCLKEWTYNGRLYDETIVRNYDLENNRFYGRPQEMIHHKVGDIVVVAEGDSAYWGIVYALPPTPDEVNEINNRAAAKGYINKGGSMLDYSDDCYTVLTSDEEYMASHKHRQANHIIPGWFFGVPDKVKKVLQEGLKKAQQEDSL